MRQRVSFLTVWLAVLFILATATASPPPPQDDDVGKCLANIQKSTCVKERLDCSKHLYHGVSCLATPIPPNLAGDFEMIDCCFHCCVQFHLNLYQLDPDSLAKTSSQLHRAFPDPAIHQAIKQVINHQSNSSYGILWSSFTSSVALSSHVLTLFGSAARGPVLRIATMTGVSGLQSWMNPETPFTVSPSGTYTNKYHRNANRLPWSELKGTDMTLLTPTLTKCLSLPFGNINSLGESVLQWYSTQLPCKSLLPTKDKSLTTTTTMMHVMALGICHPPSLVEAFQSLRQSRSNSVTNARPRLLDCSCAAQTHGNSSWGREILSSLAPLCSLSSAPNYAAAAAKYRLLRDKSTSSTLSHVTHGGGGVEEEASKLLRQLNQEVEDLVEQRLVLLRAYYNSLLEAEFVLSLSSPQSLGPCEWEAVASGAKVLMPRRTHDELLGNPLTAELYRLFPVRLLPSAPGDIVKLTAENLRSIVPFPDNADNADNADNNVASIAPAFLPFWLHRFSKSLVRSKPHHNLRQWQFSASIYAAQDSAYRTCPAKPIPIHNHNHNHNHKLKAQHAHEVANRPTTEQPADFVNSSVTTINVPPARNLFSSVTATPPVQLEIVVPLCCEAGQETSWLQSLGEIPGVSLSLWYKCPQCIPKSLAPLVLRGLQQRNITPRGIMLLEDNNDQELAPLRPFTFRQRALFDTGSTNTKEVSAYLSHIVEHYDNLAPFTLFTHAAPEVHAHFELFFRAISHALYCPHSDPIAPLFVSLNYLYRSGMWGQCCGSLGSCKRDTWAYLFGDSDGDSDIMVTEDNIRMVKSFTAQLKGVSDIRILMDSGGNGFVGKGHNNSSTNLLNNLVPSTLDRKAREALHAERLASTLSVVRARKRQQQQQRKTQLEPPDRNHSPPQTRKHIHHRKRKNQSKQQQQQQWQPTQSNVNGRRRLTSTTAFMQQALKQSDIIEDKQYSKTGRMDRDWGEGNGFAAYNSAQFLISRTALRSVPRALWLKMLLAINGSHPLKGCALSTTEHIMGGHQLTGQYERMWHILFGYPRRQGMRTHDRLLPQHLRIDCKPFGPMLCQAPLEEKLAKGKGWFAGNVNMSVTGKRRRTRRSAPARRNAG